MSQQHEEEERAWEPSVEEMRHLSEQGRRLPTPRYPGGILAYLEAVVPPLPTQEELEEVLALSRAGSPSTGGAP